MTLVFLVKVSLISLFLFGCKAAKEDSFIYERLQIVPHTNVKDPFIKFHIDNFVKDFKNFIPKRKLNVDKLTSYRFQTMSSDFYGPVGRCIKWPTNHMEIIISPYIIYDYWILKAVVYHELAHCLFDLKHSEEPGIMFKYQTKTNGYYKENWQEEFEKFKKYVFENIK